MPARKILASESQCICMRLPRYCAASNVPLVPRGQTRGQSGRKSRYRAGHMPLGSTDSLRSNVALAELPAAKAGPAVAIDQLQAQGAIIRCLTRGRNGGSGCFRVICRVRRVNPCADWRLGRKPAKKPSQLCGVSLVGRGIGRRNLIWIVHTDSSVFLQFAQALFFLFLLLRQVLLTLFILVIRFCQFITLIAARLDCRSSKYRAKTPARRMAFCAHCVTASSESAAYRQKYRNAGAATARRTPRRRFTARPARLAVRWHPSRPADNALRADR